MFTSDFNDYVEVSAENNWEDPYWDWPPAGDWYYSGGNGDDDPVGTVE